MKLGEKKERNMKSQIMKNKFPTMKKGRIPTITLNLVNMRMISHNLRLRKPKGSIWKVSYLVTWERSHHKNLKVVILKMQWKLGLRRWKSILKLEITLRSLKLFEEHFSWVVKHPIGGWIRRWSLGLVPKVLLGVNLWIFSKSDGCLNSSMTKISLTSKT